jgi:hypothetical protein
MSVASRVRETVEHVDRRSFVRASDLDGSRPAVHTELSRLVRSGELVRVRKGLYWRPPERGRRRPSPLEAGMAIAGPGSGPAGVSAARLFGLTTQVPGVETVAVAGRPPAAPQGVRFVARSYDRRAHDLNPYEVGLLEVLRSFESVSEEPFSALVGVVDQAIADDRIRCLRMRRAVQEEWDLATRQRWDQLEQELDLAGSS